MLVCLRIVSPKKTKTVVHHLHQPLLDLLRHGERVANQPVGRFLGRVAQHGLVAAPRVKEDDFGARPLARRALGPFVDERAAGALPGAPVGVAHDHLQPRALRRREESDL